MAGQRRDDEQLRLAGAVGQRLGEMQEPAERPLPGDALGHRHVDAADAGMVDAEFRLAVAARGALEELGAGRHAAPERGVRQRVHRVLEIEPGGIGRGPERAESGVVQFIELVVQALLPPLPPSPTACCVAATLGRQALPSATFVFGRRDTAKPLIFLPFWRRGGTLAAVQPVPLPGMAPGTALRCERLLGPTRRRQAAARPPRRLPLPHHVW